jgi:hypothetical protein
MTLGVSDKKGEDKMRAFRWFLATGITVASLLTLSSAALAQQAKAPESSTNAWASSWSALSRGLLVSTPTPFPPGGVYTCSWIASHPDAAAQAGVTCSRTPPPDISALTQLVSPMSWGCNRLPASGYIGQGVYAWNTEWHNVSSTNPNSKIYWLLGSPIDYTWYMKRSIDNYSWALGRYSDTGAHTAQMATDYSYKAGVQNHSSGGSAYSACFQ